MILNYYFDEHCHEPDNFKNQIILDCQQHENPIINIFAAEEHSIGWTCDGVEQLDSYQVNYLLGGFDLDWYKSPISYQTYFAPNRSLEIWPDFFFKSTFYNQKDCIDLLQPDIKNFKYPVMCLNKHANKHRIDLLNKLHHCNLIKGNAISWLGVTSPQLGSISLTNDTDGNDEPDNSEPVWWLDPAVNKIDPILFDTSALKLTERGGFNELRVPLEWGKSFLHVVTESVVHVRFITEKTVKCLLGQNLFVSWAAANFHQALTELGLELYDEVIDYSFDKIENCELRLNALTKEIERLTKESNFQAVYNYIKPKLEYNQRRSIDLATNGSCPELVKKYNVGFYDRYLNLR